MKVLHDVHVRQMPAAAAVTAARRASLEAHAGQLMSPPRLHADVGPTGYVFTAGGIRDGQRGFRAYRTGPGAGDQLVAGWQPDGRLAGVVVGDELGARRTGAPGAVAADALARPESAVLAVIGTGRQAWTQVWAVSAVRRLSQVQVFSRDPARRARFARRVSKELGLACSPVRTAEQAVSGADVAVLATTSTVPVLDAAAVGPGTHVTTVGPKWADAHETPLELLSRAAIVTCDSPQQAAAYGAPFFADPAGLTALSAVVAGDLAGRTQPGDITVHCSVGLAGTEVVLAAALLAGQRRRPAAASAGRSPPDLRPAR